LACTLNCSIVLKHDILILLAFCMSLDSSFFISYSTEALVSGICSTKKLNAYSFSGCCLSFNCRIDPCYFFFIFVLFNVLICFHLYHSSTFQWLISIYMLSCSCAHLTALRRDSIGNFLCRVYLLMSTVSDSFNEVKPCSLRRFLTLTLQVNTKSMMLGTLRNWKNKLPRDIYEH
jgi:hypothetical protein